MALKVMTEEEFEAKKKLEEQWFDVKLLSRGKHGYPEKITCRPLKVKDLKPLIVSRIENEVEYLKLLVAKISDTVIDPQGMDLREVTVFDFFKILLSHRINSLGNFFDVRFICECGKEYMQTIDLMTLEERYIDDSYPGDPVRLESGISVRFPRISALLRRGSGSILDLTDMDLVEDMVVGVDVDELNIRQMKDAMDFVRRWYGSYGLQDRVKKACPDCGRMNEEVIPYLFFLLIW